MGVNGTVESDVVEPSNYSHNRRIYHDFRN